jgi:UDP-N-acetylmuramate dehydrogenase
MRSLPIERDVPMAPLTTLALGGSARFFVRAESEDTLLDALRWAADAGLPSAILGGGSNLLVPDEGYPGLVVHMAIDELGFEDEGGVRAGAGVPWERVVDGAVARGWAGIECLTGIPGSTGATPIQNVGAYGQEVGEVLEHVRVVRRQTLAIEELAPTECELRYRGSVFKQEPERFVVVGVRLRLRPGAGPTLRYAELVKAVPPSASLEEVRHAVLRLRRRKSMVLDPNDPNHRSAGSFFLNPIVPDADADRILQRALRERLVASADAFPRYPAGEGHTKLAAAWLIERAGFEKGFRRGAFGISTNHALALVHHGGGRTADLLAFADEIRRAVRDRFGVELEREPRLLEAS